LSRLDRDGLIAALSAKLPATPDPDGAADLIAGQGRIVVAAAANEIGPAIDRAKALDGYRWVAINAADLFVASPKTIGTKVGILDASGRTLKAADLPRRK
jgi:hypothetical protein